MTHVMNPGSVSKTPRYVPMVDGKPDLSLGMYAKREQADARARLTVEMGFRRVPSATPVWVAWRQWS